MTLNIKEIMEKKNSIVFDLDGTLIDSAETIILALESAFRKFQVIPVKPIDSSVIGPALDKILIELVPETSGNLIPGIFSSFREFYDDFFCVHCTVYPDVIEALEYLSLSKRLFVVTNKRVIPTKRILAHYNLDHLFENIYCIDSITKQGRQKRDIISHLLSDNKLESSDCIYIGDTVNDLESCSAVAVDFIFAEWGYGNYLDLQVNCSESLVSLKSCNSIAALI